MSKGLSFCFIKKRQIAPFGVLISSIAGQAAGSNPGGKARAVPQRTVRQEAGQKPGVEYITGAGIVLHVHRFGWEVKALVMRKHTDTSVSPLAYDD